MSSIPEATLIFEEITLPPMNLWKIQIEGETLTFDQYIRKIIREESLAINAEQQKRTGFNGHIGCLVSPASSNPGKHN